MQRTAYQPTAGMPLPLLLLKTRRSGRAGLSRAEMGVLGGLADLLPFGSAAGKATACQVADASGYSPGWTRRTLRSLEDAGLVEWQRGGVVAGRAQPSRFRVVKARLVELLTGGAQAYAELLAQRKAATDARIAGLRHVMPRRRHSRRSAHVTLGASLSPSREGPGCEDPPASPQAMRQWAAKAREQLLLARVTG